jgi:hypothetical protein
MFGQSIQQAYSNTSQVLYNNLSLQISRPDHYARRSDLFNQGRICKYCGVNMDTTDLESLKFLHGKCWLVSEGSEPEYWQRLDHTMMLVHYRIITDTTDFK